MDESVTALEEFAASLECIVEEAIDEGVNAGELVGTLTIAAHRVGLAALGFFDDADSEGEGEGED